MKHTGKKGNTIKYIMGIGTIGAVGAAVTFSQMDDIGNKMDSQQDHPQIMQISQEPQSGEDASNTESQDEGNQANVEDKVENLENMVKQNSQQMDELTRTVKTYMSQKGDEDKEEPVSAQNDSVKSASDQNAADQSRLMKKRDLINNLPDNREYQFNGNSYTKDDLRNMSDEELADMRVLQGSKGADNGPIVEGVPYRWRTDDHGNKRGLTVDMKELTEDSERNVLETILGIGRYNEYYSAEDIREAANDGRVYAVDGEGELHQFTEEGASKFLYQTEAFMRTPTKYLENKTDGIPLLRNLTDMTDEATGSVVSIPHRFWNSGKNLIYGENSKEEVRVDGEPGRNGYMPGNRWMAGAELVGVAGETYLLINAFSGGGSSGGSGTSDPDPTPNDGNPTFGGESGFYNGAN